MVEIVAAIRLLRTDEGGRRMPLVSGYRPTIRLGGLYTDVVLTLVGRSNNLPGGAPENVFNARIPPEALRRVR